MASPKIEPIQLKEYTVKQSKYAIAAKLPMRSIILGPSGSGKTILLQSMILDIYRGCFNRIYIISPTIFLDHSWNPVQAYIKDHLNIIHSEQDPIYFDHYDSGKLEEIVETQTKIIKHLKAKEYKKLYQILIVLDDVSDSPQIARHSKLLHALYTRGRHSCISTITSVQGFSSLHPLIRKNATQLYVYRLRNYKDLETIIEELAALADKKTILKIYNSATDEAHSFLYVNLMELDRNMIFMKNFTHRITIT